MVDSSAMMGVMTHTKRAALLLVLFIAFAPQVVRAQSLAWGWPLLESEEGNFEIEFPGIPSYREATRDTRFGDLKEHIFELENEMGDFSAEYTDLSLIIALLASDRMIFNRAKRAMLEEFHAKERYYVDVELDGMDGRELAFEANGRLGLARFFIRKKRLYVLVATAPKASPEAANVARFVDSFSLLKWRQHKPHKYIDMIQQTLRRDR